jgi:hypothetical protein
MSYTAFRRTAQTNPVVYPLGSWTNNPGGISPGELNKTNRMDSVVSGVSLTDKDNYKDFSVGPLR